MFYVGFESHITEKLGIILVNWPLAQLVSPGAIGSRLELQTLYNAWSSGATHFRRLSPAELELWQNTRFNNLLASTSGPGETSETPAQDQTTGTGTKPPADDSSC